MGVSIGQNNKGELTMKAIAIIRCSSKPQFDKYGAVSQLKDVQEGLKQCPVGVVDLYETIQLQESASGWNRVKWETIMKHCIQRYQQGQAQVVVFPRVDRETRFLAGSFPTLLEVIKSGMLVYFALERLLLDPKNPDSFETYQREVLEAQAYIRVLRRNTTKGKRDSAERNEVPSGFGRYNGWMGLRWNKERKMFVHTSQIKVVAEVLRRGLQGQSSSCIVRDLQARCTKGIGGNLIQRSAVSRILKKARVYAGIIVWNGTEIRGKVENPIISEAEADVIDKRLKRNKENSHGFGKRTWLTGRVFCGLCGRRYNLNARKGCYCNGADNRNPTTCAAPSIGFMEVNKLTYGTFVLAFTDPDQFAERMKLIVQGWESEENLLQEIHGQWKRRQDERDKRRRLLSFQHEMGGLTNEEYIQRLDEVQKEAEKDLGDLVLAPTPAPPSTEEMMRVYNNLDRFLESRNSDELLVDPRDKSLEELADAVNLKVIIGKPKLPGHRYSAHIVIDLPVPDREYPFPNEKHPIAMVFHSSSCPAHLAAERPCLPVRYHP
jgi:hypothetical protein